MFRPDMILAADLALNSKNQSNAEGGGGGINTRAGKGEVDKLWI